MITITGLKALLSGVRRDARDPAAVQSENTFLPGKKGLEGL